MSCEVVADVLRVLLAGSPLRNSQFMIIFLRGSETTISTSTRSLSRSRLSECSRHGLLGVATGVEEMADMVGDKTKTVGRESNVGYEETPVLEIPKTPRP